MRSRLLAVAEYLRARPVQDFVAGAALLIIVLFPFAYIDRREQLIGVPAAIATLIIIGGALGGGPRVGAGLAFVGGVAYDVLVITDRWLIAGPTTIVVVILWLAAGFGVGLLGDRYRGQVARALDQAHDSRDALDRVVGATPLFHARGGPAAVARAICDVALETFDCQLAALFAIEGERLRLLARSPYLARTAERLIMEPSFELQQELAENLLPQFVHDVREPFGPRMPRAVTSDPDQVSAIRAPVLLDDQPVALLALSWSRRMPEPERGDLGVVQRFAEHAAVALAQAQRAQAQQDVAALYRRFQSSLSPVVKVESDHIKVATYYRPGEARMLLGGDFIDAVTRPNGSVAAVIGDVTGHGPDAAALGASLRAAWRALALRGASLQANMKTLNSLTLDESDRAEEGESGLGLLATVCAVEIDGAGRRARFVNAGHPMPLLLGAEVVSLEHTPGMMLGVEQYGDWAPHEVTLPEDWGLLLYSDGIVEARLGPGTRSRLGLDGLRAALADLWLRRAITAADLERLVEGVQADRQHVLEDDVTLLLLSHDGQRHAHGHVI
ncbi:MAG TPA: PP2C family protein-serine/threonine phosphatase [Thermoleophilia bacterium]|nr:PP2C family protein-serine/threonine phosphatase [Thermoleophilia bacterium]